MPNYFKLSSLTNGQIVDIEVEKYWGPKEGDYGTQYEYDIIVEGQPHKWYATAKAHEEVQRLGDRFSIKKIQNKIFDYLPMGSAPMPPAGPDTGMMKSIGAELKGEAPRNSVKEPVRKQDPDWDAIARGKVRNSVATAYIELHKGELNDDIKKEMTLWCDWIMTEL